MVSLKGVSSVVSEAYNQSKKWVDTWIHTGHLFIEGKKMSKSLKNFLTVDDYFQQYNADNNNNNNNDNSDNKSINQTSLTPQVSPRSLRLSSLIGKPFNAVTSRLSRGFGRRSVEDNAVSDSNSSSAVSSPATSSKFFHQPSNTKKDNVVLNTTTTTTATGTASALCVLYLLPKHVLYNILEYMVCECLSLLKQY